MVVTSFIFEVGCHWGNQARVACTSVAPGSPLVLPWKAGNVASKRQWLLGFIETSLAAISRLAIVRQVAAITTCNELFFVDVVVQFKGPFHGITRALQGWGVGIARRFEGLLFTRGAYGSFWQNKGLYHHISHHLLPMCLNVLPQNGLQNQH